MLGSFNIDHVVQSDCYCASNYISFAAECEQSAERELLTFCMQRRTTKKGRRLPRMRDRGCCLWWLLTVALGGDRRWRFVFSSSSPCRGTSLWFFFFLFSSASVLTSFLLFFYFVCLPKISFLPLLFQPLLSIIPSLFSFPSSLLFLSLPMLFFFGSPSLCSL